jgi:hypothetical protein
MRKSIACALHQMLVGRANEGEKDGLGSQCTQGDDKYIQFF